MRKPKPVLPNIGIEAAYRRRLQKLIQEMHESFCYWIKAKFKANQPAIIAQDAIPADALQRAINKLSKRWQRKFDKLSDSLAEYFAQSAKRQSDSRLRKLFREAGLTVEFQTTAGMKDIFKATVKQNVALIKSIPQQYFKDVQGSVMRSVQEGRDLASLSNDLQDNYGVTKRRAALIARDQNNKATSAFVRARQQEMGVRRAKWWHSHAGKEPRPSHVAMNGKPYDIDKGMWDPHEKKFIWPGQLINCRCTSQTLIPGVHQGA